MCRIGPWAPFTVDQARDRRERRGARHRPDAPGAERAEQARAQDYRGWVQERGLYFAATWDAAYKPLFSMNDAGDKPLEGAAIVARHGKGAFVYTGIGFFLAAARRRAGGLPLDGEPAGVGRRQVSEPEREIKWSRAYWIVIAIEVVVIVLLAVMAGVYS